MRKPERGPLPLESSTSFAVFFPVGSVAVTSVGWTTAGELDGLLQPTNKKPQSPKSH